MKRNEWLWIVMAALIVGGIAWGVTRPPEAGKYDGFAKCLTAGGAKMYGAFWCPHCQEQKFLFGPSWQHVDYIECSTPDRRGQLPVCSSAGIEGYPTWEFADGSRAPGLLALEELAGRTGCQLGG